MDLQDFNDAERTAAAGERAPEGQAEAVRVTLDLAVYDREALWDAAAAKALATAGMRLGDVIDVIGPREDPEIAECVAMLAQPTPIPGCEFDRFDVETIVTEALSQSGDLKAA